MTHTPQRRILRAVAPISTAFALVLALAACSDTKSGKPAAQPTPSASSASSSSGGLAKTQFIAQMDAVCEQTDKKVKALAEPASATDYPGIVTYFSTLLEIYTAYDAQAKTLVAQSPDRAELTAKWLAIEEADFAAMRPMAAKAIAAAKAQDAAGLSQIMTEANNLPDHTTELAAYLTGYGLKACAALQNA